MKKIKICMLVTNSLKKDPRVQREARSAYEHGFDVTYIGQQDEYFDEIFLSELPYGFDVIRYSDRIRCSTNLLVRAFRMTFRFWSFVFKTAKQKPDVIHCNDLNTLLQGYLASKLCGARVVYDSHEVNTEIGAINLSITQKKNMAIEKFLIYSVDYVVSVSNSAAKLIGDHYHITQPTVVTNCSFRVNDIDYYKPKDGFQVLYQGIMSPSRGYEEFIRASRYMKEPATLILRGYGPSECLLRNIVEQEQLDQVTFVPPVEISELITKATDAHVGVVLTKPVSANFKYTVGNKVFEYINAGLPCILSDVPEHRYLNEKFNFAIIVQVTPQSIAQAIDRLSGDRKLYNIMKANAIEMAKELCWENEVIKLINIYKILGLAKP